MYMDFILAFQNQIVKIDWRIFKKKIVVANVVFIYHIIIL